MEKDLFEDLMASVSEAGEILRGEREPARATRSDTLANPNPREIRDQLNLSRDQFARVIGVSDRTVEGWEQGRRKPSGPALALLRAPRDTLKVSSTPCEPLSAEAQHHHQVGVQIPVPCP